MNYPLGCNEGHIQVRSVVIQELEPMDKLLSTDRTY